MGELDVGVKIGAGHKGIRPQRSTFDGTPSASRKKKRHFTPILANGLVFRLGEA